MTVVQRRLKKEETRVVAGTGSEGEMFNVMIGNVNVDVNGVE